MMSKYTDKIFYQNLAEILEWNLHEESVILTAEKSDVQKAKNPKWSYRPNTYVLGRKELAPTINFLSAIRAIQLNLPTAAEANEQLALTQEVLDAVRAKFGEEARILNNQAGQAAATLGQRPLAVDTPHSQKNS